MVSGDAPSGHARESCNTGAKHATNSKNHTGELENSDIQVSWFRNAKKDLSIDMKFVDAKSTLLAGKGASKKDQTWIRMKEDLGEKLIKLISCAGTFFTHRN